MAAVPTTQLLLVRHGESNVTVRQVVGGMGTCTGLSPLGVRQAEALRDRLAVEGCTVDGLWASTLPRAIQTAQIVNEALGVPDIATDAALVEHWHGEAEGMAFADVRARYRLFDMRTQPDRPLAPGGESLRAFHERAAGALGRVVAACHGRRVMVVCHGGVIDVAFREYLRLGLTTHVDLWTLNTSITEFALPDATEPTDAFGAPRGPQLRRYNDAAHLAGLPARTPIEPAAAPSSDR